MFLKIHHQSFLLILWIEVLFAWRWCNTLWFDTLIEKETGIATYLAEDPLTCVAVGTGRALEYMDKITKNA